MSKRDRYEEIRAMTDKDRRGIHLFAMERSREMLQEGDGCLERGYSGNGGRMKALVSEETPGVDEVVFNMAVEATEKQLGIKVSDRLRGLLKKQLDPHGATIVALADKIAKQLEEELANLSSQKED